MSISVTSPATVVPEGTWASEPVHSSVGFSARHMGVATYRGQLPAFSATLTSDGTAGGARFEGRAPVAPVTTQEADLTAHLLSPEFLDAERHPEVLYASRSVTREGDDGVVIEGDLSLRGVSRPVTFRGTLSGPLADPFGGERIGLDLEATIDRRDFGIGWSMELPGGGLVLGHRVRLVANLELVRGADR